MTEAADKTLDLIKTKYPEIEWLFDYSYDMLSVECPTAHIAELLEFLRDASNCASISTAPLLMLW